MSNPVKKFSAGAVQVAIWENDGKEGAKFNTVSIQRSYKDKDGEWKSSNSLNTSDLPKAILTLQKAYEYLALKEAHEGEKLLAAAL